NLTVWTPVPVRNHEFLTFLHIVKDHMMNTAGTAWSCHSACVGILRLMSAECALYRCIQEILQSGNRSIIHQFIGRKLTIDFIYCINCQEISVLVFYDTQSRICHVLFSVLRNRSTCVPSRTKAGIWFSLSCRIRCCHCKFSHFHSPCLFGFFIYISRSTRLPRRLLHPADIQIPGSDPSL